jgi:hypothetical protein
MVCLPCFRAFFARRRGMAISIRSRPTALGAPPPAPLVQLLISTIGWRETYLAQAVFMAAAVPLLRRSFAGPPVTGRGGTR